MSTLGLLYYHAFRVKCYPLSHCCQDFVTGLSILLRGTLREKLEWTFHLYDINKDGYINREVRPCSHSVSELVCASCKVSLHCVPSLLSGDDWNCESHLWHDGQVHLPCTHRRCATAACGCLLSGWILLDYKFTNKSYVLFLESQYSHCRAKKKKKPPSASQGTKYTSNIFIETLRIH